MNAFLEFDLKKAYYVKYNKTSPGVTYDDIQNGPIILLSWFYDGTSHTIESRGFVVPNGISIPDVVWDAASYGSATARLKITAKYLGDDGYSNTPIIIYALENEILNLSSSGAFNACVTNTNVGTFSADGTSYSDDLITGISSNAVSKILRYGISLVPERHPASGKYYAVVASAYNLGIEYPYPFEFTSPLAPIDNLYYYSIPITEQIDVTWTIPSYVSALTHIDFCIHCNGEDTVIATLPDSARSYTISPSQYLQVESDGILEVQFRANLYNGSEEYSSITIGQIIQAYLTYPYCTNLSPANAENLLGNEPNTLTWQVTAEDKSQNGGTNYPITNTPSTYDIQYSSNGGESWVSLGENITCTVSGTAASYTVPANTFPNGIIQWRVRPRVNGYVIDNWSKAVVTVQVQASTSSVTCDGRPMPTVSWTSSAQVAYQVRFADYDSGAVFSSQISHKIPYIYANGIYPVQVRTQASNGNWSAWTEVEYVQLTNHPWANLTASLTVTPSRHAVVMAWQYTGNDAKYISDYIIYRNNVPIAVTKNSTYTDTAANGDVSYFVRAYSVMGANYNQTETVSVNARPAVDCMYDSEKNVWIPLKHSLSPRLRNYSFGAQVYYKHYNGRKRPITFSDGYATCTLTVSYVFRDISKAESVANLAGKMIVYKDTSGGVLVGILNDVRLTSQNKVFEVSFTVNEIDREEKTAYETT